MISGSCAAVRPTATRVVLAFVLTMSAAISHADSGALKQELVRIDSEIASAQDDDAKLAGGLNKALIGTRLQVLKTNRELVFQRIQASEAGAKITVGANSVLHRNR